MAKCKKYTNQFLATPRIGRLEFWKILFVTVPFPFTPQPRENQYPNKQHRKEVCGEAVKMQKYYTATEWIEKTSQ